ncbi:hypothetical protein OFO87_27490, partial [Escherichia coli]|nr:hypothetical protein [Escherichia coli]
SVHHIWCPLFSQEFQDLPDGAETTLTKILTPTEWKLLWVKLEGKQLPSQTPTLKWACLKLGRWHDSKRTGRPGWVVMWDGWFRLQDMVEGYPVMKSLDQEI